MSSLQPISIAGAIGLTVIGCSSVTVTTDFERGTSFARYHSYSLEAGNEKLGLSPSSQAALRQTLQSSLATRGISENADSPQLHIVSHVSTKEKIVVQQSINTGYAGVPYRYGRYQPWIGAPMSYSDVSQYTEGTLVLDFVDAKSKALLFRGTATAAVRDRETNAARIKEAVEKIVADLP